jgi:hypothetical protein
MFSGPSERDFHFETGCTMAHKFITQIISFERGHLTARDGKIHVSMTPARVIPFMLCSAFSRIVSILIRDYHSQVVKCGCDDEGGD